MSDMDALDKGRSAAGGQKEKCFWESHPPRTGRDNICAYDPAIPFRQVSITRAQNGFTITMMTMTISGIVGASFHIR